MKSIEQTAREVYEGCYKIAEIRNYSEYTYLLARGVHLQFANQINLVEGENVSKKAEDLVVILEKLDKEFYPKFKKLEKAQAKTKKQ